MKKLLVLLLILSSAAVFSAADSDAYRNRTDSKDFEHHLELYNQAVANRDFAGILTSHAALREADPKGAFDASVNNEALLKFICDIKPSEYLVIAQILNLFPLRSPISKAIREQNWQNLRAVIDRLEQQHTTQNYEPAAAPSSVPTQISAAPIATTPIQVTTAPIDTTALDKAPSRVHGAPELSFFGGKHIPSLKGMLISEVLKNDLLGEIPESYFASQEALTQLFSDYMKINDLSDVLPDIAKEYFLCAKANSSTPPAWLQAYFEGVSVSDYMKINGLSDISPDIPKENSFCIKRNLNALPAWLQPHFKGVSVQDLIDNNMLPKAECHRVFRLNNLYISDLTGLQNIPGIGNIAGLILMDNNLTTIAPGTFAGLNNFPRLFIKDNNLTTIAPGAFAGLNNLPSLTLSTSNLTTIAPGTFAGLNNLRSLNLSGSNLTTIAPGAFADLDRLEILNLKDSNIQEEDRARIQAEVGNNVRIHW